MSRNAERSAAALLFLLTGGACNPFDAGPEHFVVRADSIVAPDSVDAATAFAIRVLGGIGPDQCSSLDRVERRRTEGLLELRFHGVRDEEGACPDMPAMLDHTESIAPPFVDPFTVRVLQPEGPALEAVIQVR